MTKPKPKPDDPGQFARFIKAAKKAEVDESGKDFRKAFEQVVKPASPPETKDE